MSVIALRQSATSPARAFGINPMTKAPAMARERILVVDDEEDLLELVNYNLTKEGYRVRCVATGEEALEEARQNLPDLIVLDLLPLSVDGLEICRLLKMRRPHRPYSDSDAHREERRVGRRLRLGVGG